MSGTSNKMNSPDSERDGDPKHSAPPERDSNPERGADPEVCLCFHVPLGKLAKFHRLEKPRTASQFSSCYQAGTGCGWCVPFLEHLFEQLEKGEAPSLDLSPGEYAARRAKFRQSGNR